MEKDKKYSSDYRNDGASGMTTGLPINQRSHPISQSSKVTNIMSFLSGSGGSELEPSSINFSNSSMN